MTGKEILLKTLRCEEAPRVPWVPFVGVHAGKIIGVSAEDYLKSTDLQIKGLSKAIELYKPDGLPISFDLQMEAEVLGCQLKWAKDNPPSVASHPLATGGDIDLSILPKFDISKGRFQDTYEVLRKIKEKVGESIALYGLICGPFTLALHLRGEEIFIDMFEDEDAVAELMDLCANIGIEVAKGYIASGADVIAVVDPMLSQISAAHFNEFVAGPCNKIFDAIKADGALASLFVCGDATRSLDVMCKTHCDNLSVDENVDMSKLREVAEANNTSFGGNLQLTIVLLMGSENDAKRDAMRCYNAAEGAKGFVLAPGCDLPFDVPEKNLVAVTSLVDDDYQRDIARQLSASDVEDTFDDYPMPDYAHADKLIVDVVTLNSEACAACQYITKAAMDGAKHVDYPIEVTEHRITGREGLAYMKKLGVTAIPSICIHGVPTFASITPDRNTLLSALNEAEAKRKG